MSGRGARIAAGLLGLFVIAAASIAIVTRAQPGQSPNGRPPPPPSPTDDPAPSFQNQFDCFEPLESRGISQRPAPNARREIDRIARAVESIRRLRFEHDVDVAFLAPDQVARRAARLTLKDYPPRTARVEGRMLEALGAIPRGTDLRRIVSELIESQVAGFYVPEKEDLVVPGLPEAPLGAFDRTILAHELEHAVADQNLDLPLDDPDPEAMDANQAVLAVVEGDATLTMQQYAVAAISSFEQLGLLSDPRLAESQQALTDVPHYLVAQLSFPYETGLTFVCDLYARGGWKAVNRAYRDLPRSTAQVMFPERYGTRERPVELRAPKPPAGFEAVLRTTFGAANLKWLFEAPGGDTAKSIEDPLSSAAAWAGGEIHVFSRAEATALSLHLAGRDRSGDLCASVWKWYDASFSDDSIGRPRADGTITFRGGSQTAVLACKDERVRLGIGPHEAIAAGLAARD
jgi:hypothetical protein